FNKTIDDLKYQTQNQASGSDRDLATIKYRYKKPGQDRSIKSDEIIANKVLDFKKVHEDVKWSVGVAEFGLLLRNSPYKNKASYEGLIALLSDLDARDPYQQEFKNLVHIAKSLDTNPFYTEAE